MFKTAIFADVIEQNDFGILLALLTEADYVSILGAYHLLLVIS